MKDILKFNQKNFIIAIFIFFAEVSIATVFKNIFFVRSYLGDVLVVMLIYYFIRSFLRTESKKLIIGIFIFACIIEFLQYFHFSELLGFQNNKIMMTVLGNSFSWLDILCYFVGCSILFFFQKTKS